MREPRKVVAKKRFITIAIILVAILLLISILLLLFLPKRRGTSSSTGNVIENRGGGLLRFADIASVQGSRFRVENMFPGDSEFRIYLVEVVNEDVKAVRFQAEPATGSAILAEGLNLTVVVDSADEPLYSGPVVGMPALRAPLSDQSLQTQFTVTVGLDTSAGNEYQNSEAILDLNWWIDDADCVTSETHSGSQTTDDGKCCPWCFGACPWCWIIIILLFIALILVLLILLAWRSFRKKRINEALREGRPIQKRDIGLSAFFGSLAIGASIVIHSVLRHRNDRNG